MDTSYTRSSEIEIFIISNLALKAGSKKANELKGLYEGIIILGKTHRTQKSIQKLKNYLFEIMDIFTGSGKISKSQADYLKVRIEVDNSGEEIYYVVVELKNLLPNE